MNVLDPSSPWYPLAVAAALAVGRGPGSYHPRFEHWLYWRFHFQVHGEGFVPAPALPTDSIPEAA